MKKKRKSKRVERKRRMRKMRIPWEQWREEDVIESSKCD